MGGVCKPNPYERGFKINMNGCPNSCAHHHIGDIGLQGCLARRADGPQVEAFDIYLCGDRPVGGVSFLTVCYTLPGNVCIDSGLIEADAVEKSGESVDKENLHGPVRVPQ